MPTARHIMTPDLPCIAGSLAEVARKMAQWDVGSLPIESEDNRLKEMLTDRDIAIKAVAQCGNNADVTAG
jgi:predicted transcriptional regulator